MSLIYRVQTRGGGVSGFISIYLPFVSYRLPLDHPRVLFSDFVFRRGNARGISRGSSVIVLFNLRGTTECNLRMQKTSTQTRALCDGPAIYRSSVRVKQKYRN